MRNAPLSIMLMGLLFWALGPGTGAAPGSETPSEFPCSLSASAEGTETRSIRSTSDGPIEKVTLEVEVLHESPGDLAITLHYDENNDGTDDASVPVAIAVSDQNASTEMPFWFCPLELDGTYRFDIPSEMQETDFSTFRSGGSFHLQIVDLTFESRGTLMGWNVEVETREARSAARSTSSGMITLGMRRPIH